MVTTGNFLVDSESRLRAAIEGQTAAGPKLEVSPWSRKSSSSARATGSWSLLGVGLRPGRLDGGDQADEARRHPRPLRSAGHRLHRVDGAEPDAGRGPGHLPDRLEADRHAARHATCAASRCSGCRSSTSIFEEGTDIYWARSRVLEYMNGLRGRAARGRDADARPRRDRHRLGLPVRAHRQDRQARPRRAAHVPGLHAALRARQRRRASPRSRASAATRSSTRSPSIPNRLRAYGVTLDDVIDAIRQSNNDVGGRILEMSGREYYVRGRGYITGPRATSRRSPSARSGPSGTPLLVQGRRRRCASARTSGAGCSNGTARARRSGGIVVMRYGENALDVIERVKKKLAELKPSFPDGRGDDDRLRPLGAHRALDRHAQARAHRGGDRRSAW